MESESWALVGENGEIEEVSPLEVGKFSNSVRAEQFDSPEVEIDTANQLDWEVILTGIFSDNNPAESISEIRKFGRELLETHYEPLQRQLNELSASASINTIKVFEKLKVDAIEVFSTIVDAFPIIEPAQEGHISISR